MNARRGPPKLTTAREMVNYLGGPEKCGDPSCQECLVIDREEAIAFIGAKYDEIAKLRAEVSLVDAENKLSDAMRVEFLQSRAEIADLRLKLATATCDALTAAHAEITRLTTELGTAREAVEEIRDAYQQSAEVMLALAHAYLDPKGAAEMAGVPLRIKSVTLPVATDDDPGFLHVPIEVIDEELRKHGVDPIALAKRGLDFVNKAKAELPTEEDE